MEATAKLLDMLMRKDLELMLWIRLLLVWNGVLTAAFVLTAIVLFGKLKEAKGDFAEAVCKALK